MSTKATKQRRALMPKVDIHASDDELLLTADLPGVDLDHLKLWYEDGKLTIEAQLTEGVLTLHLPKAARVRPRRIEVSSA